MDYLESMGFYIEILPPRALETFQGLAIDSLEMEWKEYSVFHFDFNGTHSSNDGTLQSIIEGALRT